MTYNSQRNHSDQLATNSLMMAVLHNAIRITLRQVDLVRYTTSHLNIY